jgi:hypothetical protein
MGLLMGLPATPSLNFGGLAAQGLVVLGVVVMGDDKPVFLFVVARLLLVGGVVAEGRQHPPHNLGAWESLECSPCFIIGHAPLKSKGQLCRCRDAVIRVRPSAAVPAYCASSTQPGHGRAPDGSGRQGLEWSQFPGANTCDLIVVQVVLLDDFDLDAVPALGGHLGPLPRSSGSSCSSAAMEGGFTFAPTAACALSWLRWKRNDSSLPRAFLRGVPSSDLFLGVPPAICGLLTPPSSLAACGVLTPGQPEVVRDLEGLEGLFPLPFLG